MNYASSPDDNGGGKNHDGKGTGGTLRQVAPLIVACVLVAACLVAFGIHSTTMAGIANETAQAQTQAKTKAQDKASSDSDADSSGSGSGASATSSKADPLATDDEALSTAKAVCDLQTQLASLDATASDYRSQLEGIVSKLSAYGGSDVSTSWGVAGTWSAKAANGKRVLMECHDAKGKLIAVCMADYSNGKLSDTSHITTESYVADSSNDQSASDAENLTGEIRQWIEKNGTGDSQDVSDEDRQNIADAREWLRQQQEQEQQDAN